MKETLCHTPELPFEAGACTELRYLCASVEELEAVRRALRTAAPYVIPGPELERFKQRLNSALVKQ